MIRDHKTRAFGGAKAEGDRSDRKSSFGYWASGPQSVSFFYTVSENMANPIMGPRATRLLIGKRE
jgi:hypothetical protein